jgi:hypothetical protein
MNPPPTVGLKTLIIFGLSFVKQLAHGLVKRFAGYVTLLNAFVLVASFRGYPGVKGSKYKTCRMGDGLITPLNTFVKPYSIPEVKNLLDSSGFKFFHTLQNYRVNKPQNIHIKASLEE